MVAARLECDDRGTSHCALARPSQRHDLRVRTTGGLRRAHPGDGTLAVQDDRTDGRIRIRGALDGIGLGDGRPHRVLDVHALRCLDAEAA